MDLFTDRTGSVFADVGAHAGRWVLPMAQYFERVYAFEPNPDSFYVLCENVKKAGLLNVITRNLAISNRPGKKVLCELDGAPSRSTLYPEFSRFRVTRRFFVGFAPLSEQLAEEPRVSLIKVDVEGSELDVLKSAHDVLTRSRPRLCIETHSNVLYQDCAAFLNSLNLAFETRTSYSSGTVNDVHKYIIRTEEGN